MLMTRIIRCKGETLYSSSEGVPASKTQIMTQVHTFIAKKPAI